MSIHSIVTTPRESFYWLTVLVTVALGTAAGDWTVEPTGWTPGTAVLLPAALILAVLAAWRLGAGPVLSSWLARIVGVMVHLGVTGRDEQERQRQDRTPDGQ